jgi:hypothetical protein
LNVAITRHRCPTPELTRANPHGTCSVIADRRIVRHHSFAGRLRAALPCARNPSVAHGEIEARFCHSPCTIRAIYDPTLGVYLDEKLDAANNAFDRSILLHELVHHVQAISGGFDTGPATACDAAPSSGVRPMDNAENMGIMRPVVLGRERTPEALYVKFGLRR